MQVLADSLAGQSAWSATTTGTPSAPTATVAANSATITEGSDAVFTVTLNPAPSSNLTVNYGITVSGNYGVSAATNQTVTVGTGGTGTITLCHHQRHCGRGQRQRHRYAGDGHGLQPGHGQHRPA